MVFRCCCALVVIVLNSMKNLYVSEANLQLQQTPFCFYGSNLRAVWVRTNITSCFAKSFPLPHLLFPHLLNQTSFSCIGHLLAKLNIL